MTYFLKMSRLVRLDPAAFTHGPDAAPVMRHATINILVLGLIYGGCALGFGRNLIRTDTGQTVSFNPLLIIMVGISIAFLMHAGAALFFWVFSRGMGGRPQFMPVYLNVGVAGLTLWPLAPALAALQVGIQSSAVLIYTLFAGLYAMAGLFVAVKSATGLSSVKMTIAALGSLVYIGCFLYLWM